MAKSSKILSSLIVICIVVFVLLYSLLSSSPVQDNSDVTGLSISVENSSDSLERPGLEEVDSQIRPYWDHMPLTYRLEDECITRLNGIFEEDILDALNFITQRTDGIIRFERVDDGTEADITYICSEKHAGEISIAEARPYLYSDGTYAPGEVYFYSAYDCMGERSIVMIHETLHMLGLDHNSKTRDWDVMREFYYSQTQLVDSCDRDIIPEDINFLKETYNGYS